jgi:small-conductance mechanosensitive channel
VSTQPIEGSMEILVGGQGVFVIVPDDVDRLAGETLEETAETAASRLRTALAEAAEARAPRRLLRSVLQAAAATLLLGALLWVLRWLDRVAARRLRAMAERRSSRTWKTQALGVTRLPQVLQRVTGLLLGTIAIVLVYLWVAFVLRRFPYTRPWGESLRTLLFTRVEMLLGGVVNALPGLFTVALILVAARVAVRGAALLFTAVEQGRLSLPSVYPDTAAPTRRLVTLLVWLFALAMAYPYIPGSESPGVKGISVFLGVIVSLGSTGVVQHMMSGLTLVFSRAVHAGDYARIGDVEGTILQIGALATKVRTPYGEEVTIPNTVVVSQTTTNYSAVSGDAGAMLTTSVTIGYDTPWRQVETLLLTAARGTPGVRATPAPTVWRAALEDWYVKYTLLVAPEDPRRRLELLDRLHALILDAFNEQGVQIMSPHYVIDPATPKIVPPTAWYAAPVARPGAGSNPHAELSVRS